MDCSPGLFSKGKQVTPFGEGAQWQLQQNGNGYLCGGDSIAVESSSLGPCLTLPLGCQLGKEQAPSVRTQPLRPRWEHTYQGGQGSAKARCLTLLLMQMGDDSSQRAKMKRFPLQN